MTTFLSRDEVKELTGRCHRRKQCDVLLKNGVRFTLNAAGWPMVVRSTLEKGARDEKKVWKPNKAS